MKSFNTTVTEFRAFLQHPHYQPTAQLRAVSALTTARAFAAELPLVGSIGLGWVATVLVSAWLTGTSPDSAAKGSAVAWLLTGCVLLPMLIEGIFRTPMRLTPRRLGWLTVVGLTLLTSLLLKPVELYLGLSAGLGLTLSWLLLTGPLVWFVTRPARYARIDAFWQRHLNWVFYGLTVLAASVYFPAWDSFTGLQILWFPVILLPGLLVNACLGYVRLKYGYWYAVAVHGLLNLLPVLVLLINRV